MREILFRGKTPKGEWVEGLIGAVFTADENRKPILRDFIEFDCLGWTSHTYVYDETVGQYTGLTDKNGKRIFEGDIIDGHCHSQWSHRLKRCVVAYGRDGFEARHYVMQGGEERYYTYKVLFSKDVVVIGNITDNPELLKGGGSND